MQIIYVARHDQPNSTDDEGSITHALTQLGHKVERLHESRVGNINKMNGDFILFHHMRDTDVLRRSKLPKVFWCFDLIDYPDPSLSVRNSTRRAWIRQATDVATVGFCTDGDWAAKDKTGKLVWLTQGADDRIIGKSKTPVTHPYHILFTGIARGGVGRESFVNEMDHRWGTRWTHISSGIYRESLANLIAGSRIVVAPDAPVTNLYASNRIYNALGFGAFLLHPYSAFLAGQYIDGEHLIFYRGRADLHDKITYWLGSSRAEERLRISTAGMEHTRANHTYRHRCEKLIEIVRQRL